MADNKAATFEASLERLETIVKALESDTVSLDDSIALFREGRELAQRCESLLKSAQEQIDAAVAGNPAESDRLTNGRSFVQSPPLSDAADDELPF